MPDIKTRDSLKTIKTFQRAGAKVKDSSAEAKRRIEETQDHGEASESEYAGNRLESAEGNIARTLVYGADKVGRWGVRETSKNIRKLRQKAEQKKWSKLDEKYPPKQLPSGEKKALPKATSNAAKTTGNTAKTTGKTVKTTEQVAKNTAKTAEKTVKATQKAAKATAKAAQKAAQMAKVAAQKFVQFCKLAAKAIVAVAKGVVAAVKGIAAAIAAGGWVAVAIILLICLVALVLCSAFGVFAPSADGEYSIGYVVSEAKNDYNRAIAEITSASPHDYVVMDGELAPMKEVIAVFAVRANAEGDELMTMEEAKKDQFLLVFWGMNTIRAYTEEKIKIEIVYETDADGNTVEVQREKIEVYLHIETTHLTAEQGADAYSFTDKQKGTMREMLDSYFDDMWDAVLSEAG